MGIYLNPGNGLFEMSVNSDIYVDKSMLIDLTNSVIRTDERHICISRPRRFGKSMAANMLSAYYSRGCDSRDLFRNLRISGTENFEKHRNKYNVIRLDIRSYISANEDPLKIKENITEDILYEISEEYPDIKMPPRNTLEKALATVYIKTGIPFVFIIDEWDSVFRVFPQNNKAHTVYLDFLRDLLKDKEYVALDYATGIFPVKKYGEHSALNMYHEYTMTSQKKFAEYTGFTIEEVEMLCGENTEMLDELKRWYDGYKVDNYDIFNPCSVVQAITDKTFDNYWTKTETFEALKV